MGSEFHAVKGRLPATPTSLKSTTFPLGLENFGINPWCVGSLDNCFGFDWGMDVENGFEGGGKLICKVGCIECWVGYLRIRLHFIELTRVGHIPKKLHEGHLGVFFDPQKEIIITSELLRIFQPNFTGISHIWSEI